MAKEKPKSSSISTLKSECIMEEQRVSKEARQEGPMPSIIDEIMKDLTQPNISIFGVYGTNIYRKASLVGQINKRVQSEVLFDAVVMASVTENPDLKSIQVELGNKLGLRQLNEITTPKKRAARLCDKIKTHEKILIIIGNLDDEINLAEMGIPFRNHHMGCKVLLIASAKEVLSHKMKTQKEYCVDNETGEELDKLDKDNPRCVSFADFPYMDIYMDIAGEASPQCSMMASNFNGPVGFESMESFKLNEMIMAMTMRQPNMSIVGMCGSSNTINGEAVEQIKRRVERDGLFDVVLKATVVNKNKRCWRSRSPDVRRIQGELTKQPQLQLDDKTSLKERATRLCDTIKTKNNILILLDHLQAPIDLGQI